MTDETEPNEPYGEDPLDLEDRVIDLENMVALHTRQIKIDLIVAMAGLASGALASFTLSKIAKAMTQYGVVLQAHEKRLNGGLSPIPTEQGFKQAAPAHAPREVTKSDIGKAPIRPQYDIDETRVDTYAPTAEPILGPQSEASERVRDAIANDGFSPGELLRNEFTEPHGEDISPIPPEGSV